MLYDGCNKVDEMRMGQDIILDFGGNEHPLTSTGQCSPGIQGLDMFFFLGDPYGKKSQSQMVP